MLAVLGVATLDELIDQAVPKTIRTDQPLHLPDARSEPEVLATLRALADRNRVVTSLIGTGYHDTHTPGVILRNVLENPAWYTAYTPYQPEISQGRLEALLNFQTMVTDLTGMDIANASMLDESTAAAEAMTLIRRSTKHASTAFFVDAETHPQTIAVVAARAEPIGIELVVGDMADLDPADGVRCPPAAPGHQRCGARPLPHHRRGARGRRPGRRRHRPPGLHPAHAARRAGRRRVRRARRSASACRSATAVPTPGSSPPVMGCAARCPAGWSACRSTPPGRPAHRLALQTREQHIRREKATSNICTAQVLLAVIASMYAVYHGPEGLRHIAERVHGMACPLAATLRGAGVEVVHDAFFDTVTVRVPGRADERRGGGARSSAQPPPHRRRPRRDRPR